jgi:hypothetical protein
MGEQAAAEAKLGPKINVYVVDHTGEQAYTAARVFMSIAGCTHIQ